MKNSLKQISLRLTLTLLLGIGLGLGLPASAFASAGDAADTVRQDSGNTFTNPLNDSGPDPWLTWYEGSYYLAATTWGDASKGLTMRKAATIQALKDAQPVQIWQDSSAERCCNLWAPEFFLLDGPNGPRWYGYFTGGAAGTDFVKTQFMHVIESAGTDPMGPYTYKGKLVERNALDGTVLQLNGKMYAVYSVWNETQDLAIREMGNPWQTVGEETTLSKPELPWERQEGTVNEGPVALQRNGKTFIIYSASACWGPNYKLGMLTYTGGDPLAAASWTKSPEPVFQRDDSAGVYAPGHNTFFKSPDGTEDWFTYHANDQEADVCDMGRTPRIQKFNWNADGTPAFGKPVSTSTALTEPSSAGASGLAATSSGRTLELTVQADKPGLQISRYLYGQFAEHLGRGIYEGIWVGRDSKIPNTNGYRDDVIKALKDLQIPVIRWPGGCFADEYHWRDGIGPRKNRPVRVNTHWGGVEENNAFGTHEFFDLVEMLGSEAYIAGNVGSGTPQEMAEWLEYMTADNNSMLASERRKNGRDKPWKVAFFGVGNETWGCGGNMRPEYYADLYRRYATFLKAPEGNRPKKVASGGYNELTNWTETLSETIDTNLDGISHHYYTIPTGEWTVKGKSTGFPEQEWISTLFNTMKVDEYLSINEAVLDKSNPDGNVGLYLDEWGTWYDPEPGSEPGFLYQQNTLRDAVVAGLNFNIFHGHARRLHMANIAQTVNVLQAVILTDKEKMVLTPTYHAFEMYRPFQDSTFIPAEFKAMTSYTLGDVSVPKVSASAAKTAGGDLVIALVNLDPHNPAKLVADLQGYAAQTAEGRTLTAPAMDASNTFAAPESVTPTTLEVALRNNTLILELPAKSVSVITLKP